MRVWQTESGHLVCRWSEVGRRIYSLGWMQETSQVPSGHLTPIQDFASHSPFGGPFWFQIDSPERNSELNQD